MTYSLTWLPTVLRNAGCKVEEMPGWTSRGRAEMGKVMGVICHHTAGPKAGNAPSLNLIVKGRPDLAGPLSQLCLGRDGTFYVVAAGKCNHAGAGSWQGVTTGNTNMIGIEAENTGLEGDPWPAVQLDAYARGVAAILTHSGVGPYMAAGHKEYALPKGRKSDPSFDMDTFRAKVAAFMRAPAISRPVAPPPRKEAFMTDPAPTPVVVSANAGVLDTLMAAGRLLVIIAGTVPLLLTLLSKHDFMGLVGFFRGTEGATFIGAVSAFGAIVWALWKSHKRGSQVAAVAADERVPESVATLK